MKSPTQLLTSHDYLEQLIQNVKTAQTRIYIVALVITDDHLTGELMDELLAAAKRGVDVNLASDLFFTYRELGTGGTRWSYIRTQIRNMYKLRRRLQSEGASVTWLGHHGLTFFSRRTHSKWSVVDDVSYAFGGANMCAEGITNKDYMLEFRDPDLADMLVAEQQKIIKYDARGRSSRSRKIGDDNSRVLFDGGLFADSIIYRHACALAEQSTRLTYVSQYSPTGKLGRLIKRTSKESTLYFNRWQNADSFNRAWLRFTSKFKSARNSYNKTHYLHAKFIIFELKDGSKVAITGSHNYVAGGGLMGTREVALETRDARTIELLESYLAEYVA